MVWISLDFSLDFWIGSVFVIRHRGIKDVGWYMSLENIDLKDKL